MSLNSIAHIAQAERMMISHSWSLAGQWRQFCNFTVQPLCGGLRRLTQGSAQRELRTLFGRLDREQQNMEEMARGMEQRFLAAGEGVKALNILGDRLLAQSQRLASPCDKCFGGHKVLEAALNLIEKKLEFAQQCQRTNTQTIARLASFTERIHHFRNCDTELNRILTPLKTVNVLYKIQSTSLTGDEKAFFAALTENITQLQEQARADFGAQLDALVKSREILESAIPRLKEQAQRQDQQLAAAQSRIENSLKVFRREATESDAQQSRLAQACKEIAKATGPAVVALQYQDITHQKWEHVMTAVAEMRSRCENTPRGATEPLIFLHATSRLQSHQLEAIESELASARTAISESIHTMLEHLKGVVSECQQMSRQEPGTGGVANMVRVVLGTMNEARVWMPEITKVAKDTCETVGSVDKTVSDVAGTLRKLAAGIGLIAINAQVQAAHVGGNTGLGILAEHTSAAAKEIQQFSETEGIEFDALVNDLAAIANECTSVWEQAQTKGEQLDQTGLELEHRLQSCRDKTLSVVHEASDSLRELQKEATAVLATVDFETNFKENFNQLRDTLEECSSIASKFLKTKSLSADATRLDQLKQNYTMESERAIHAASLGQRATGAIAASPLPLETVQPPLGIPSPAVAESAASSTEETIDLAGFTSGPEEQSFVTADQKKPDFGDNVELF